MLKPDSLRRALTDAVTVLKTSPEMLRIFVDNGSIASTLATSLSFEKRYTLNVIVTDFTDRKSTRLNSSHANESRMPSSA